MRFGICASLTDAAAIRAAGWDYVEEHVQNLLQAAVADGQWKRDAEVKAAALPVPVANCLVPGSLKITGPQVDAAALRQYMTTVLHRAGKVGIQTLVFGSGVARNVPDGFDRKTAVKQITDFVRMAAEIAAGQGVTIVAEPLNRGECNILNSVAEAMEYVKAVDHPNFQCLVDSYHFWLENEPLENLRQAMPWIKHVHLADKDGRVAPGLSGKADYRPFFRVLKQGGYDGRISFEGTAMPDFTVTAPKVLAFVKQQWSEA
jgi:sugar phosphate isomerase/epimerase